MPNRLVYYFGNGHADGGKDDAALLGGKGANLGEMTRLGVPVPPGFTITTEVCRAYLRAGRTPEEVRVQVADSITRLEKDTGKVFGGSENPLLVSVRSGAAASMPGMMDTILNLGLNDRTVEALAASGNSRFAHDSYRRFVQMYGAVVLGVPKARFEDLIHRAKAARGAEHDTDLDAAALRELATRFKAVVLAETGEAFPDDPYAQLWGAIEAVFRSWNGDRAIRYRRAHGIPDDLGTAVNVVSMVYGNMGNDSGTGVAFTRNPSTGDKQLFGEFLLNAQGEDVVAGIRDPLSIDAMATALPEAFRELNRVAEVLERHYREMQDLEFTVERGKLYLLQARTGKRSGTAAVTIAVDMVAEGLIHEEDAVLRVTPERLVELLHRQVDPAAAASAVLLATGLPASPGAAAGRVVFDPDVAEREAAAGKKVILVRAETSPDDFHGMVAAQGIVTSRGGMTSHAAVVARGMGKCCVVGARDLLVDMEKRCFRAGDQVVHEGEWVTLDGTRGRVLLGAVATVQPTPSGHFYNLMSWADRFRRLRVRTNADTPADAAKAREFGAEGIGLCRTEHMFFEGDRIQAVREMILAENEEQRRAALAKILPMQREDFVGIFRSMDGLPVTIRLLDPPLHEFLPQGEEEIQQLADRVGLEPAVVASLVEHRREENPMLGHRGVRLGLTYPEITEMQVRAIFEAAVEVLADGGDVRPEIMVPLIGDVEELRRQKQVIERVSTEVLDAAGVAIPTLIGTMIELPRAALTAGRIAPEADFFSFGTNDLTQTVWGISRDDAGSFLPLYLQRGILEADPFEVLDQQGVGRLIAIAAKEGRAADPTLKLGICGEHGGDPRSVAFFHATGLDYVSCSPYRVPVARLAAAQAAIRASVGSRSHGETDEDRAAARPATAQVLTASLASAGG